MIEINEKHIDLLTEIGNISSGNSATALSVMLNKKVDMRNINVKTVNLLDMDKVGFDPEQIKKSSLIEIIEGLNGHILFSMEDREIKLISDMFGFEIDPKSLITEVSNIITGSYVSALASMLGISINISAPQYCEDMYGSMINHLVSIKANSSDVGTLINTEFIVDDENFSCCYMFLLDNESLNRILEHFGKYIDYDNN